MPRSLPAVFLLLCLSLFVALFSGCQKSLFGGSSQDDSSTKQSAPVAKASPLEEARAALASGDYARAEVLAQRESTATGKSGKGMAEASRILAVAAFHNNHPNVAISALEQWRTHASGADEGMEWQDLWCGAMAKLPSRDAKNRAEILYGDSTRSFGARGTAGIFLAVRQWEEGNTGNTLDLLNALYASAPDQRAKAMMEGRLALQLHRANAEAAAHVALAPTAENQGSYPYSIILIDRLRRETLNPATRAAAQAALDQLAKDITLADPSLFKGLPSTGQETPAPRSTAGSGHPVVLALPLSGPMAGIASRIVDGAEAACREGGFSLITINTDQPDWTSQVNALPREAVVIGGPLNNSAYTAARNQGLTASRAFFTFLPGHEGGEEGAGVWRFFPSAADQLDALFRFTSTLGIVRYGVFYPDEPYGQRMSSLFQEKAGQYGGSVTMASYAPGQSGTWLTGVSTLIAANKSAQKMDDASIQALFLPDTWKSMDMIVPNIFYEDETRLVLMGTSLWELGIAGGAFVSPEYYKLGLFPGAWNQKRLSAAGEKLQQAMLSMSKGSADFWSGLGYDFARMSGMLKISGEWTPASINAALQGVRMDWSTAPMHWDTRGRSSQDLYVFTPVTGGFTQVNEEEFRKNLYEAWNPPAAQRN